LIILLIIAKKAFEGKNLKMEVKKNARRVDLNTTPSCEMSF